MRDALAWLQASALGTFMRDSGPWTYPIVNLIHILGVATLFGAVLILDLRLMGVWRRAALQAIATAAATPHLVRPYSREMHRLLEDARSARRSIRNWRCMTGSKGRVGIRRRGASTDGMVKS